MHFKDQGKKGIHVIKSDCTAVQDAKIKNDQLTGKVRFAPRGDHYKSLKASWHSTSPTAAAIPGRVSELWPTPGVGVVSNRRFRRIIQR